MSRSRVLGAAAALAVGGCIACAQTNDTKLLGDLVQTTRSSIFDHGGPTVSWAPDRPYIEPEFSVDADSSVSLLGTFESPSPDGDWMPFLTDLDFGAQGNVAPWAAAISAIPEPSSWVLLALGGLALAARFPRRSWRSGRCSFR